MARVPMVTRTITTTNAKVLCVSIAENKTFEQEIALPRRKSFDEASKSSTRKRKRKTSTRY